MPPPRDPPSDFMIRALCLLACVPSGGALLAKVYGIASLQAIVVWLFLPGCLFLAGVAVWSVRRRDFGLTEALGAGLVGGLLGTIGYDLFRLPFYWCGFRVFAPHGIYGMWCAETLISTRFTDAAGWVYHFSNGLAFGLMYSLLMRGRHWGWAIAWALMLESIAIYSPYGRIFNLRNNYPLVAVAYTAHLAYGMPLGLVVQHWRTCSHWLAGVPRPVFGLVLLVGVSPLVGMLVSAERRRDDRMAQPQTLRIDGVRLIPGWIRVDRGNSVAIAHPNGEDVVISIPQRGERLRVSADGISVTFDEPRIYQIFVETNQRTRSSFVAVEPVEALP